MPPWWKWWHRWGWHGPYPGHGPWSHLPPPARPGWQPGRCRWLWWLRRSPPGWSKEEELKYLEELRKYISDVVLKEIDKRMEELRGKKEA
ncbi:MAG: hypothetical protein LM577_04985 [Thermoproteaceae archaeon]|jgi:hypothetical protein|nr:hypothetical protein [Thermoproteaceae archaeon]